jgi:Protein kinase domain
MSESTADRNPFERLAEEFAERLRRGEHPAITDYVARYPDLADDIRELFPEIAVVEQYKPARSDVGMSSPATPRGLPERFGDYRILRAIGEGAMGVVYEAVRESLRSNVALKVMHPQFRDRQRYLRRFRTEARSAARLHHTNIVSVFDYGVHDGVCYYAMQYIAGHSLDRILADVRQLRREKVAPPVGVTTTVGSRPEGPPRPDRRSMHPQPGDAAADGSRRVVTLGLLTGQWAIAPQSEHAGRGETPPRPVMAAGGASNDRDPLEGGCDPTARVLGDAGGRCRGHQGHRALSPGDGAGPDRRRERLHARSDRSDARRARSRGAVKRASRPGRPRAAVIPRVGQLPDREGRRALLSRGGPAGRAGGRRPGVCP